MGRLWGGGGVGVWRCGNLLVVSILLAGSDGGKKVESEGGKRRSGLGWRVGNGGVRT